MVLVGRWEESEKSEDREMTRTTLIHLGCIDKGSDLLGGGLHNKLVTLSCEATKPGLCGAGA